MTLLLDSGNFRQRKISVAAPAAEQQLSGTKRGQNVPGERKIGVSGTKRGRNVPGGKREGVRSEYSMNVYPIEIQFGDDCIFILFTFIDLEYFKS